QRGYAVAGMFVSAIFDNPTRYSGHVSQLPTTQYRHANQSPPWMYVIVYMCALIRVDHHGGITTHDLAGDGIHLSGDHPRAHPLLPGTRACPVLPLPHSHASTWSMLGPPFSALQISYADALKVMPKEV